MPVSESAHRTGHTSARAVARRTGGGVLRDGLLLGAERLFWKTPGVYSTAVATRVVTRRTRPTRRPATGRTGHTEAVQVVYDPTKVSYEDLLKVFWENHDPTQGNRQGNDVGKPVPLRHLRHLGCPTRNGTRVAGGFQPDRTGHGLPDITTEIAPAGTFFYAEDYHQQYLSDSKNPGGYCTHGHRHDLPVA